MTARTRPRGHELRKGRVSQTNQIYLVTAVTYQRERLFEDLHLGRVVVHSLRYHHENGYAQSLAFVVMPDHLHWLVALGVGMTLSALVGSVKGYSARQINRCLGRSGPVWQEGFHDHALRAEEDLRDTARYLVANPLRAGLVKRLGDYPLWDAVWI